MANQPELTLEEHFNNLTNVQMTDCLFEKHGEEILAHLIKKGVKPPSSANLSKYRSPTSNIPQGSQNAPEGLYIPNVPPVEGWHQPKFGNAILYHVNHPPHTPISVMGGPQVPDPNNPFSYGMLQDVPQLAPLTLTTPPLSNQPPVNTRGTPFTAFLPPPMATNLPSLSLHLNSFINPTFYLNYLHKAHPNQMFQVVPNNPLYRTPLRYLIHLISNKPYIMPWLLHNNHHTNHKEIHLVQEHP